MFEFDFLGKFEDGAGGKLRILIFMSLGQNSVLRARPKNN